MVGFRKFGGLLAATLLLPALAAAQPADYPSKPIRLVVPYAPGGIASLIMMDLRVAKFGKLRQIWTSYLGLGITALAIIAGAGAMIEMVYHLQFNDALGADLGFMGANKTDKDGTVLEDATPEPHAHRAEIGVQQQRALDRGERRPRGDDRRGTPGGARHRALCLLRAARGRAGRAVPHRRLGRRRDRRRPDAAAC